MHKDVKQQLVEEEKPLLEKKYSSEFESASAFFGLYSKYFENLVKELSTGQLRRLVNALVQYPLNDKEFINEDQNLKDAFNIGERMIQCKLLMIQEHLVNQSKGSNENGDDSKKET